MAALDPTEPAVASAIASAIERGPSPRTDVPAGAGLADLREELRRLGARPVHERALLAAWLAGRPLPRATRAGALPARLAGALQDVAARLADLAREVERVPAADGTARSLLRLRSGRTVESVDLLRGGLCVSTQVGCAVGCRFCKTGEAGLLQQLGSAEVLAQVALARARRPELRRVVLMGMGEPLHNLDAVLEAVVALGELGGFAHKALVVSTVGEERAFERLAASPVRPALALSLHALDRGRRERLLPRAPRAEPRELLAAALAYADRTTYPLLVQWTLLEGETDREDELRELARLVAGRRAIVNLIPFNAVEGSGWRRPDAARCVELVRLLKRGGATASLRRSAAQEVDGGCGQLRARALAAEPGSALPGAGAARV